MNEVIDGEYCELWFAAGDCPQLTLYTPDNSRTVALSEGTGDLVDGWHALGEAMAQLSLEGWEMVSASHGSPGLLFKRDLM